MVMMVFPRLVAFTLGCLAIASNASPAVEPRQTLAQVITKCNNPNQVALTFDDGPWIYNGDIVNTLNAHGAVGTFFVNGHNWGCIYDANFASAIKAAYDAGHQVSSHTWSHPDLTTLTWDQIHNEMWLVEQAMMWILGAYPAMMRPPYGNYNNLVRQAAAVRGQKLITWDFDSGDSAGATVAQSEATYSSTIASHPSNILALNHETYETTAHQVLPYVIQKLQAAGYKLVSVATCTGQPAYQWTGPAHPRNSSWHC